MDKRNKVQEFLGAYACGKRQFELVDLRCANLQGANLHDVNLCKANLRDTNLLNANLAGTRLDGTCLDPMAAAISCTSGYEKYVTRSGQVWCRGYRARRQPMMRGPEYVDGQWYEAPVFSVADTDRHPGMRVYSTAAMAKKWGRVIAVWFRETDLHHARGEDRVRAFWVEGAQEWRTDESGRIDRCLPGGATGFSLCRPARS